MSRTKVILVLLLCVAAGQALTAAGIRFLPAVYLHAPRIPRTVLIVGASVGLLVLLLKHGECLPRSECLALVIGSAGGLANLVDILRFGAVVDYIPVAPATLASPGDFLIIGGFLVCIPITIHNARSNRGLHRLYRRWRAQPSPTHTK